MIQNIIKGFVLVLILLLTACTSANNGSLAEEEATTIKFVQGESQLESPLRSPTPVNTPKPEQVLSPNVSSSTQTASLVGQPENDASIGNETSPLPTPTRVELTPQVLVSTPEVDTRITSQPSEIVNTMTPLPSPTLVSSLVDIEVKETVEIEMQFIQNSQEFDSSIQNELLNSNDLQVRFESWSPDGNWMLLMIQTGGVLEGRYVSDPPEWGNMRIGISDLWLANREGVLTQLLDDTVFWNAWSPDSLSVAYIHRSINDGIFSNELWVVQINSGKQEQLISDARSVAWLDNQTIIFVGQKDEQLRLLDVNSRQVAPFIVEGLSGEGTQVVQYDISPNRQFLALNARGDTKVIAEIVDRQAKVIANLDIPDASRLKWSPDSKQLAIAPRCSKPQQNEACQHIHIIEPDGKSVSKINFIPDTNIDWHPDGDSIVFLKNNQIYIADVASGQAKVVHAFASEYQNQSRNIQWSPDGTLIGVNQKSFDDATIVSIKLIK